MKKHLHTVRASIPRASNARQSWDVRESVEVRIEHDGFVGRGEAAPLPGVSSDSFDEALAALERFVFVPPHAIEELPIASPSARFAAESALYSWLAASRGLPLFRLFAERADRMPLALAIWDDVLPDGAEVVKVKIGMPDDHARLERVRRTFPNAELRLDANRAFGAGVEDRLRALAPFDPAFVEEPAPLEHLFGVRAPFALAIDESVAELDRALGCDAIRVVVIKPTLYGLVRSLEIARRARAAGREVVISHALEGEIARASCAHLALAIGGRAPGLGAHPALRALSGDFRAPFIHALHVDPPERPGL